MRKIIKVIDEENIEISRYLSPEARFFNPCTDIHNDYDKYESYCDFKEVINPFKMYAENERLHYIIKEVREYITSQKLHKFQDTTGGLTYQERKLLEILDKEKE